MMRRHFLTRMGRIEFVDREALARKLVVAIPHDIVKITGQARYQSIELVSNSDSAWRVAV